jgi:two-component system response regulator NreC
VRILLADDHAILREGIRVILESQPDLEVVGEASTGREAIAAVSDLRPDLVLMDLTMPDINGMEATVAIKRTHPAVQVLVLTMHDSHEQFFRLLQAGASGYVLKGGGKSELLTAIRAVAQGGVFLHPSLAKRLVGDYLRHVETGEEAAQDKLTEREAEVLRLIAEGRTSREIAESLVLSPNTVERHRQNIMAKLGLHSRADLIKYAIRRGIVDLDI